jgi:hypothetical protein
MVRAVRPARMRSGEGRDPTAAGGVTGDGDAGAGSVAAAGAGDGAGPACEVTAAASEAGSGEAAGGAGAATSTTLRVTVTAVPRVASSRTACSPLPGRRVAMLGPSPSSKPSPSRSQRRAGGSVGSPARAVASRARWTSR